MTTISAPAFITVGDVIRGSKMSLTWGAVDGALAYLVQRSINGATFGTDDRETFSVSADAPALRNMDVGEDWNTVQFRVQAVGYDDNNMFLYSDWTTSPVKTVTSAPAPSVNDRLEQFQNSGGAIIYPQTIVEGVFRKSDGKTLADILDDTVQGAVGPQGPAGPGVPTGGTAGQVLAKNTAANYDTHWIDPPEGGSGVGQSMAGQTVQPVYNGEAVTSGEGAEIFNDYRSRTYAEIGTSGYFYADSGNIASGIYSHAEGSCTNATGECSHAEGKSSIASGKYSHAENAARAYGKYSHTEGNSIASGDYSHAEGANACEASGMFAHSEGYSNIASGDCSHVEGQWSEASGYASHAEGAYTEAKSLYTHCQNLYTIANAHYQTAIGSANIESTLETDKFIVGKGNNSSSRANCFRATHTGVYASGSYNASGADYAEMFEWADGNPDGEDRAGRFVTLDGAKIRLAGPEDDYIIGVVSGNPSVVGDVHDDQWQGMFLYDIFGRPLWEYVEIPEQLDQDGNVVCPAHTAHRQRLNPDYDNTQTYRPRSQRPEWDAVGMLGKLVAVDDGSCIVDGWCTVGEGGIAVGTEGRTRYRVMERIDESHIRLLIL